MGQAALTGSFLISNIIISGQEVSDVVEPSASHTSPSVSDSSATQACDTHTTQASDSLTRECAHHRSDIAGRGCSADTILYISAQAAKCNRVANINRVHNSASWFYTGT